MRLNLKSNYEKCFNMNISNIWRQIFENLYNNIDLFATNPEEEHILFKKIDPYSRRQDKYFTKAKTEQP